MRYLIDTDWVIDYLLGRPAAVQLVDSLLPQGAAISIVTYSEIHEGILGSSDPRRARLGFRRFLRSARVLPISRPVAEYNATVRRQLRSHGKPVDSRSLDLLIAATALQYRLVLVTRNQRDYADVPQLVLKTS